MSLSPLSLVGACPESVVLEGGDGGVGDGDEYNILERQLSAVVDAEELTKLAAQDPMLFFCVDSSGLPALESPAPRPSEGALLPFSSPQSEGAPLVPLASAQTTGTAPFAGCELKMHLEPHESHPESIVSNAPHKWFHIGVELFQDSRRVQDKTLSLRASLVFENGTTVHKNGPQDEEPLVGQTNAMVIHGGANLKMRVGKGITSELRNKQRFRVLIEPVEDAVRIACPALTLHSDPFRVMVKIHRRGKGAQCGAPPPSLAHTQSPLETGGFAAATATYLGPPPTPIKADDADKGNVDEPNARLAEQNARLEEQNARLAEQNARLEEQNARLAEQNARLAEQNARLEKVAKRPAVDDPPETVRSQRPRRKATF